MAAVEPFFKGALFSILKEAYADTARISKYFLTGVLPAFRSGMCPLTATAMVLESPKFHGICGLTDPRVEFLVKNYLALEFPGQMGGVGSRR